MEQFKCILSFLPKFVFPPKTIPENAHSLSLEGAATIRGERDLGRLQRRQRGSRARGHASPAATYRVHPHAPVPFPGAERVWAGLPK